MAPPILLIAFGVWAGRRLYRTLSAPNLPDLPAFPVDAQTLILENVEAPVRRFNDRARTALRSLLSECGAKEVASIDGVRFFELSEKNGTSALDMCGTIEGDVYCSLTTLAGDKYTRLIAFVPPGEARNITKSRHFARYLRQAA